MAIKLGLDCKIFRQTSGTREAWPATGAAPNLSEITNVTDVTINGEKSEADVTTRGGAGWRQMVGTLKEGTVEFEMIWDTTDTHFSALFTAWMNGTNVAMAVLDGSSTTTGTEGLWADFQVTNFSQSQALEEAVKASVTLRITYSAVAPAWVSVTAAG